MIYPVIMCGGSGTRLWPLSRQSYPKQFAKIIKDKSLFQESILRTNSEEFSAPIIITGEDFRFIVAEQLANAQVSAKAILIEPDSKNTAPAVLAATLYADAITDDAIILVMPSDHVIPNPEAFRETILKAKQAALDGHIVTFGIKPTGPETGYGYLELNNSSDALKNSPSKLKSFVEKPNLEKAMQMIESGNYLWNAGIFLFKASVMKEAFKKHAPQMLDEVSRSLENRKEDIGFTRFDADIWARIIGNSIDYTIMEKSDNVYAMPFNDGWSDLGGWAAVWAESKPDENGNVCSDGATSIDCKDTLLRSESSELEIVGIGLEDIIAIAMPDAVVISKKSQSQRVKEAVSALSQKSKRQATAFPKEHRPWGWLESLVIGDGFQVKRIFVKPGASLSLQSHLRRAEHWVVVEGIAQVTLGEETKSFYTNESVYIPIGVKHRLENNTDLPVVIIEVQTGDYLGEDDIVRYQDVYQRN